MMKAKGPVYYMPHRVVVKTDSATTKLRIVLDASSHASREISLNECVHPGTNMITPLFGILVRIRCTKYVIIADIEKAFHQVRLQEEYRNVTMLLWLKDITKPPRSDNIVVYRFTRIPFGVASSPFLLAAYIMYCLDQNPNELNKEIKENLYVDNCLFCTNDRDKIMPIIRETQQIFKEPMKMNLREYIVNDKAVMEVLEESEKAKTETVKVLGYKWDSIEDTLSIKIVKLDVDYPTKRDVASKLAETFDPLADLATKRELEGENSKRVTVPAWKTLQSLFTDSVITVPRQITDHYEECTYELAMFSDASCDVYAAAAYILTIPKNGDSPKAVLLVSKNKIKPSKQEKWTIPKLELLAIECASTLADNLVAELRMKIEHIRLFTDSACALYWILSGRNTRVWVHNRVTTIVDNQEKMKECGIETSIHHCPTKENPADLATRGMSTSDIKDSSFWFHGPEFLKKNPEEWPCQISGKVTCPAEFQELVYAEIVDPVTKKTKKPLMERKEKTTTEPASIIEGTVMSMTVEPGKSPCIVPYKATNSLGKLTRIMFFVLKAVTKMFKSKTWESALMKEFTAEKDVLHRLKVARFLVIKEHYRDSESLELDMPKNLSYEQDPDGLLRVNRQIESPVLPQEASRPILILPKHPLARLIMTETHELNGHLPENYTRSVVRTKYWIPRDAVIANQVISNCVNCKKITGFPFDYPHSKTLPTCRTTPAKPFAKIGLDYLGPVSYLKDDEATLGKAYVLIYTCLVTRATILKVLPDATSETYVLALKMIFREVGVPSDIYSDNASTFKLGAKVINQDISCFEFSHTMTAFLASQEISCRYITPLAPWQGGIYERVVGLVKHQLQKACGGTLFKFFPLMYLVSGAQSMVNNRPLIPFSRNPKDITPLRPIDFLAPGVLTEVPVCDKQGLPTGNTEEQLRQHMKKLERVLDRFWELWTLGYLNFLRDVAHREKRCSTMKPVVGQLVLVHVELVKRHKWPLGVISELLPSKRDDEVRQVKVKCRGKEITRAVCQLIPLEINRLPPIHRSGDEADSSQDLSVDSKESTETTQLSQVTLPTAAMVDRTVKYAPELLPSNVLPNINEAPEDIVKVKADSDEPNITESLEDMVEQLNPEDMIFQKGEAPAKAKHINYAHCVAGEYLVDPRPRECCQICRCCNEFANLKCY